MGKRTYFCARKAQLVEEIDKLRKQIDKYPKGTLIINQCKSKPQWFVQKYDSGGKRKRTYIRRDNAMLAQKLARKAYDKAVLLDKENELKSIDKYLSVRREKNFRKYLQKGSPYKELLVTGGWEFEDYEKSSRHPEHLIVSTLKGDMVRSKSEALIANELLSMGIPYRYENPLIIGGVTINPDFTVRNQRNQKLVVWEHFGKVDDPEYVANNFLWKMELYLNNGYVPGYNLIMTFEDKKHPLTLEAVQSIIQQYLI